MKEFLRFFSIIIISYHVHSDNNTHGQIGYINTPSAFSSKEGTLSMTLNRGIPDRKFIFTGSAYNWLDLSIYYSDITGLSYKPFKQSYKDKGFNIKASFQLENPYFSNFAIGGNDIAGTSFYSSEYIVFSNILNRYEYSLGIGWGNYNNGIKIKNPFRFFSESFLSRSQLTKDEGGTTNFKNYFSGKNASFFGGVSYQFNKNFKLIAEIDPTERPGKVGYRKSKSKINFGFEYDRDDFSLKTSIINNDEINIGIILKKNFLNYSSNVNYVKDDIKNYRDFQQTLTRNNIGLKKISKSDEATIISVQQNSYQNQFESNKLILQNAKNFDEIGEVVIVEQFYLGMPVLSTKHNQKNLQNLKDEEYVIAQKNRQDIFVVKEPFPIINNRLSPRVRTMIASREGFLYRGLLLENDSEIIFDDNILILANLKYSISDNFDGLYLEPVNTYPKQVRSDVKKYLNNLDRGVKVGRLEFNYFEGFKNKHFLRLTAGLFEEMFGGLGFDYLFYPEGSLLSFGLESYYLKKRDYGMRLNFKDYSNSILRANIMLKEPRTKTNFRISYGEYLAGDIGYTFEVSRRFNNGVEFSGFFTKTNVPIELYGEGSFDKGLKVKVPINTLLQASGLSTFEWRPLTKDPGALLIKSMDLLDQIERFRIYN